MQSRLEKAFGLLDKNGLDAIIIKHPANASYLSEFNAREPLLFISKRQSFFITDFRYIEETKKYLKNKDFLIRCIKKGGGLNLIIELIRKLKLKKIGFEAKILTFSEYKFLADNARGSFKIIPTCDLIESLRIKKSESEIKIIKKAVSKTTVIFKEIKKMLCPGISEIELTAKIEKLIREMSQQAPAFEPIVASGTRSSLPHAISSKNKLKNSSSVLIDIGLCQNGYKSDLTRVYFLSRISAKIKKIYDIVKLAQDEAIKNIKAGVKASFVDGVARNIIKEKGFGKYFGHSLGHGIGLEVHEKPSLSPQNECILEEGMVLTVEPAIYLPGEFGIRLEEMVLVNKTNCEVLSAA